METKWKIRKVRENNMKDKKKCEYIKVRLFKLGIAHDFLTVPSLAYPVGLYVI